MEIDRPRVRVATIADKKELVIRSLKDGLFGNTVQTWFSKEELFESGYQGNVYIRSRSGLSGGVFIKNLPVKKVARTVARLVKSGKNEKNLYFGEWIPPKLLIMSCELGLSERFLEMRYSRLKMTLRDAFKITGKFQAKVAHGLKVKTILKSAMDEWSFNKIMELLEEYPDRVIEFTIYNRSHGTVGRDIIIWEVRDY